MLFAILYVMAGVIAIVTDVNVCLSAESGTTLNNLFFCGRCYSHTVNWPMLLPKWQMELPHMYGLMFLPNVADGTATCDS